LPFIQTIPEDEATGRLAELYEADKAQAGFVPNSTRAFSQHPEVYAAWLELKNAMGSIDTRRYELATLAAARRLRSTYCMLAHGKVLADRFLARESVREAAGGGRPDELDAADVAVMELADKVADDATSVNQADIDGLRALGLDDREIFDVVVAAAARCFFSKVVDGIGMSPDELYAQLDPPLREALTVGRPFEPA
jgi:uncharacterized peroxidase-related enzyme